MAGYRKKPKRCDVSRGVWKVQDREVEEMIEIRKRLALRNKVNSEKHAEICGGLSGGIGIKTYLHDPLDFAKMLKLRFCVGDLDLPQRRKRYSSSSDEKK